MSVFDPSSRLYVRFRGKMTGPFTMAQIEQQRQLGRLTAFHELSADGLTWHLASDTGLVMSNNRPIAPLPPAMPEPAPQEAMAPTEPQWYFLDSAGQRQGPMNREQMADIAARGMLKGTSEVWSEGFPDWLPLNQTELAGLLTSPEGGKNTTPFAKGTTQLLTGRQQRRGNGLVVAGYICCAASVFVCPLFGALAMTCAIINLTQRRVSHGLAQLFLSIVLTSVGSFLSYLVYLEFFADAK